MTFSLTHKRTLLKTCGMWGVVGYHALATSIRGAFVIIRKTRCLWGEAGQDVPACYGCWHPPQAHARPRGAWAAARLPLPGTRVPLAWALQPQRSVVPGKTHTHTCPVHQRRCDCSRRRLSRCASGSIAKE